jgi:hypothetical protein
MKSGIVPGGKFTQDDVQRILEQSNSRFFNVTFPTPDTMVEIEHKLKRYPRKWVVAKQNKSASVYQDAATEADMKGNPKFLALKAHFDNSDGKGLLVVLEVS